MRETSDSRSCWKVPGEHTLLMSEGDERFHIKKRFKKENIRDLAKKALARGVALLGVKVTGIEPPRLTFVFFTKKKVRPTGIELTTNFCDGL